VTDTDTQRQVVQQRHTHTQRESRQLVVYCTRSQADIDLRPTTYDPAQHSTAEQMSADSSRRPDGRHCMCIHCNGVMSFTLETVWRLQLRAAAGWV